MGKKKKVSAPTYKTMEDTPYITHNRELEDYSYGQLLDALNNINTFDSEAAQKVVDDYMGIGWDSMNRNYTNQMNQLYQRNYNRLGTLGSSSGLYTQDDLQRSQNNLAANMANQAAGMYNTLKQQELSNRYANANLYNTLFQQGGNTSYAHDMYNQNIKNQNIQAKWMTDVQNAQNSGNWLTGMLGGAANGAATGGSIGGGWGALIGGVAGGALGAFTGNSQGTQSAGQLGGQIGKWINTKYGQNRGNTTISTPTNYGNYLGTSGSNYGSW